MTNHEASASTPQPEDEAARDIIRIPTEVLEASRTPEGQALYEYGAQLEREYREKGMMHE